MDGENTGKPYGQMDDLGVPLFLETPILYRKQLSIQTRHLKKAWRIIP